MGAKERRSGKEGEAISLTFFFFFLLGSFMTCIPMNTLLSFVGFNPPTGEPIEASPTSDPFSPRSTESQPFFGK